MRYFIEVSYSHQDKNKAEKASSDFLQEFNRMLIPDRPTLDRFKEKVRDQVANINSEHKRCKDIDCSINEWNEDTIAIHLPSIGLKISGIKGDLEV